MSSNATSSICPDHPAIWPVGNWPQLNQALGLANFVLHLCVSVCSVGYMLINRKESVYRSRNVVLMATSAAALVFTVIHVALREYIGREYWPCDATLWLSYSSVGMLIGPYTVQLLQLKNRLQWQDKLADMPMRLPDEMSISDLVASKYNASHARAYLAMAAYMLIMVAIAVAFALFNYRYFAGCYGCGTSTGDFLVFTIVAGLCILSALVAFLYVPKRAAGQPQHPLMHQTKVLFKCYLPLYILYFILVYVDYKDIHEKGVFSYNNLLSLVMTVLVFYTTAYPGLLAKRQARVTSISLITVLRDPVLLELFEKHLKSEFSLENLRFYMEATALKTTFPKMDDDSQETRDDWQQRVFDVYNRFVAANALLQVNLSARVRHPIEQRLDISHTPAAATGFNFDNARLSWVKSDIYDSAVNEVFRLMESDSFSRFAAVNELALIDHELIMAKPQSNSDNLTKTSESPESNGKTSGNRFEKIAVKIFLRKSPSHKSELQLSVHNSSAEHLPL